jgi:hypothetical protein
MGYSQEHAIDVIGEQPHDPIEIAFRKRGIALSEESSFGWDISFRLSAQTSHYNPAAAPAECCTTF